MNYEQQIKDIDTEITNLQKRKQLLIKEKERLHKDDKVNEYLHRYNGESLLKKHKMDETGTWEIKGEDPNCDFGGTHVEPHLAYVEGKLTDVIEYAVHLPRFWCWGAGGSIEKVEPIKTIKLR